MVGRMLEERVTARNARGRPVASVTVNRAESTIGWLRARGLIDARQFEAGERIRADWEAAQLAPGVTMRWDAGPRSTGLGADPSTRQLSAKRRFDGAIAAAGPGLSDVLWRVACAGEGMETAEAALGWPRRAGRLVLTLALDRVAAFYGIG
ncbi:DUF6456 domain-containing protein [Sphingomonas sp. ID0503]|uniref:DUF6456 domain-containing protein n=1 Tax=Sphingomonas sp. ID0503 TaxID=3399691 RepID=UPI003AFA206E